MLAFVPHKLLETLFALLLLVLVLGHENHAYAVVTVGRQAEIQPPIGTAEEAVGDLEQNARAVTGVGLRAPCAPVVQIEQDGQGLADNFVGFFAFDVDHKAYTTGVFLEGRIVESLLFGEASGKFGLMRLGRLFSREHWDVSLLWPPHFSSGQSPVVMTDNFYKINACVWVGTDRLTSLSLVGIGQIGDKWVPQGRFCLDCSILHR